MSGTYGSTLVMPDLLLLSDYGGDIHVYLDAVYYVFKRDFVDSQPSFEGKKLGLKKHPTVEGKEYTFYHFTHDGDVETERLPNLRRMERIGFIRVMIDHSKHPTLKVWRNQRGTHERILIFHESEQFLVVLDDRKDYILPWTAYLVEQNFRVKKLLKEWEAYHKSRNRPE